MTQYTEKLGRVHEILWNYTPQEFFGYVNILVQTNRVEEQLRKARNA